MRISYWSSDGCSSDLQGMRRVPEGHGADDLPTRGSQENTGLQCRRDMAIPGDGHRRLDSRPVEEGGGNRLISAYHAKYYAHELTRRHAADGVDRLSQSLFDASVDRKRKRLNSSH